MAQVPTGLVRLLGGAVRAGANVIAKGAAERSISEEVAASIKVRVRRTPDRVTAFIETRGKGSFMAPWLEHGTSSHFISVDPLDRGGMTVGRINRLNKESLVIGGKFVGPTVLHPGATAHPFLRPALDIEGPDAIVAAQNYINARVSRSGIAVSDDDGGQA
jgi:hypothetical protein